MKISELFILWGSAGHAKVLADLIKLNGGTIIALFDNNSDATSSLPGIPLFYGINELNRWMKDQESPQLINAALAIGGSKGKDRQEIAELLSNVGFLLPSLVHHSAVVSESAFFGRATQVLANSVVAAHTLVGDVCIINNNATVDHECKLGNGVHVAPGSVLCGCVAVGDNSMIGAGAVVLPRINIGKNVIVGAGAVVTRDIPDDAIAIGNPAKLTIGYK